MSRVAVIGQGYVGLPLSVAVAQAGYQVLGFDINERLTSKLNNGISIIEDVRNEDLKELISLKKFKASSNPTDLKSNDVYIICVPTPLTRDGNPDHSMVTAALKTLIQVVVKGNLIILESTVSPGMTRQIFKQVFDSQISLNIDDLEIAYSPERVDPRNPKWNLKNTPKLVAGFTKKSRDLAKDFYSGFVTTVIDCDSIEVAETAKLLENSFRLINISFINELSQFCHRLEINILDVIASAATKPYGYMPFYPSVGIGGHCIPVDPVYLSSVARELKSPTTLIDAAISINNKIHEYHVQRAREKLGTLKDKLILVIGVAYKPDVADTRDTPVKQLISTLRGEGAIVFWHDDLVVEWENERTVDIDQGYDLVVLATMHSYIETTKFKEMLTLDTRCS